MMILACLVTVAIYVIFLEVVLPFVIRYRMSDQGIETLLFGRLLLGRLPWTDVERATDMRVATLGELIRSGEYFRSGRLGKRGFVNRPTLTLVTVRRASGGIYVISPRRPYIFVQEARTRYQSAGTSSSLLVEEKRMGDMAVPLLLAMFFGLWVGTLMLLAQPALWAEIPSWWVSPLLFLWPLMMAVFLVWRRRRTRACSRSPRRHGLTEEGSGSEGRDDSRSGRGHWDYYARRRW